MRHLPSFHVRPERGWVNDPNGPVQVDGTYHLFCQHNPGGAVHGDVHWAHFSSEDLVHWRTHPVALAPEPGGPDADGCWSGAAVVVDGELRLVYSGRRDDLPLETVCVARPDGDRWRRDPADPVLVVDDEELEFLRDPFLWREGEDHVMVLGAMRRASRGEAAGRGGAVLRWRSRDLLAWRPDGVVCDAAQPAFATGEPTGDGWECPQLLRVGDRALLVVSAWYHDGGPSHVSWASGGWDGDRLDVRLTGRLDHGPEPYAPAVAVDESGRALLWSWVREGREESWVQEDGWAGVLSCPRVLELGADGAPVMRPAPELEALRGPGRSQRCAWPGGGGDAVLDDAAGDALDLEVVLEAAAGGRTWVRVLAVPGEPGGERTEVGLDASRGVVYVDRRRSSDDPRAHRGVVEAPLPAGWQGAPVRLRVLVDRSLLEVFVEGGPVVTTRVYPVAGGGALLAGASGAGSADVSWWPVLPSTAPSAATAPEAPAEAPPHG